MVVRMRRNRSETAKRRSHHALTASRAAVCECGALRQPHRACAACGKYNGKVAIDIVAKTQREQRRTKRKNVELQQSGRAAASAKTKDKETTEVVKD